MKLRRTQNSTSPDPESNKPIDPQEELYRLSSKYKVEKKAQPNEEGSVTNSLAMLTAIPEVDLGMECVFFPLNLAFVYSFFFRRNQHTA